MLHNLRNNDRLRNGTNNFRDQFPVFKEKSGWNRTNLKFSCRIGIMISINGAKSGFLIVIAHNFPKVFLHASARSTPRTAKKGDSCRNELMVQQESRR